MLLIGSSPDERKSVKYLLSGLLSLFSRDLYMSVAHILVVPLSDASFVCQEVKIPVESLKVT